MGGLEEAHGLVGTGRVDLELDPADAPPADRLEGGGRDLGGDAPVTQQGEDPVDARRAGADVAEGDLDVPSLERLVARHLDAGVADQANSAASRALVQDMVATGVITPRSEAYTPDQLMQALGRHGNRPAHVHFFI